MTTHLEAPFTLDLWEAGPVEPAPEGGPEMASVTLRKTYAGPDLTGTAAGYALTTNGPGGASYVAQERVTGTLLGREGSFVVEHRASTGGEGAEAHQDAFVVPGSGTGALAGVSGTGSLSHGLLVLDLDL